MAGWGWPLAKWYQTTTAPGVGDDIDDDFQIGSVWINTTTDTPYICVDNTRGAAVWVSSSGSGGSVTSVGLALPAEFVVTGSPVTTSGTLTGSWATELANLVFAGPSSGSAAVPTFRALTQDDLPDAAYHTHIMGEVGNTGDGARTVWYLAEEAQDTEVAAYVSGLRVTSFTQSGDAITFTVAPTAAAPVVFDYIPVLT